MIVVYSGFDGLDMSIKASIPEWLDQKFKAAKEFCNERNIETTVFLDEDSIDITGHGARGGYAYTCEIGSCGTKWFFKRPNKNDLWGIRISASSAALAAKGIEGFRAYILECAKILDISIPEDAYSITRVDFAVDILAPDFIAERHNFVSHARCNISDHDNGVATNGHSGRTTSITVGKMPGRQTILYDKREEVMVKHKYSWQTIWDRCLAQKGKSPLDYTDPKSSRIWRVEARAGKDHLQGKWGIRGWGSLYEKLPGLMAESFDQIRYCAPSGDKNRARWPTHPLWALARTTVLECLTEFEPLITSEEIMELQKEDKIVRLEHQLLGIATSLAGLHKISPDAFEGFLNSAAARLVTASRYHPTPIEERLAQARNRHHRFR